MQRNKPLKVLIPDGESFYLQKVLTCFAASGQVQLYVLSGKAYTAMRFSRHTHRFIYFPKPADDREWIGKVNDLCRTYKIDVILPMFEDRIRTLIALGDRLDLRDSVLIPGSLIQFDTANDKGLLAGHMEAHGIPSPKSKVAQNKSQLLQLLPGFRLPILLKPPLGTGGGDGIIPVEDRESLHQAIERELVTFPIVVQEFIDGFDTGCNVLCKDGVILAYTVQRGFLYDDKPFSPQMGLVLIDEKEVLEIATRLMQSLRWTGVANIDLIYDRKRRQYQVLEINPRFWSTVEGSLFAGVNFPWLYCQAATGKTFPIPLCREATFINLKGLVSCIKKDKRKLFNRELLWKQSTLKYALRDPVPMIYHFIWRTRNILLARLGK